MQENKPVMHPDKPERTDEPSSVFKEAKEHPKDCPCAVCELTHNRIPHRKTCLCGICIPNDDNHAKPGLVPGHVEAFGDECPCPQCCPNAYTWHSRRKQEAVFAQWERITPAICNGVIDRAKERTRQIDALKAQQTSRTATVEQEREFSLPSELIETIESIKGLARVKCTEAVRACDILIQMLRQN